MRLPANPQAVGADCSSLAPLWASLNGTSSFGSADRPRAGKGGQPRGSAWPREGEALRLGRGDGGGLGSGEGHGDGEGGRLVSGDGHWEGDGGGLGSGDGHW